MARSGDEASLAHLRTVWDASPERRQSVALGLAQQPGGENWKYLLNSLPILEPAAAREICAKLTDVDLTPAEAEPYRQAILLGLKMRKKDAEKTNAAENALGLLAFWTGLELATNESEEKQLEAWQRWFVEKYPGELEAKLPVTPENAKYTAEDLAEYLVSDQANGSLSRGAEVFVKAQCAKCHRFESQGESLGPDLTTIAKRFTRKELIESIVHPSHVISSQYASRTVLTTDGRQITGLVVPGANGETVILQASGEKLTLTSGDIDVTKPSKVSIMPAGLLDPLSQEEVADLFALLQGTVKTEAIARRPAASGLK
jgi:putative heme-binding domain-containing protein